MNTLNITLGQWLNVGVISEELEVKRRGHFERKFWGCVVMVIEHRPLRTRRPNCNWMTFPTKYVRYCSFRHPFWFQPSYTYWMEDHLNPNPFHLCSIHFKETDEDSKIIHPFLWQKYLRLLKKRITFVDKKSLNNYYSNHQREWQLRTGNNCYYAFWRAPRSPKEAVDGRLMEWFIR